MKILFLFFLLCLMQNFLYSNNLLNGDIKTAISNVSVSSSTSVKIENSPENIKIPKIRVHLSINVFRRQEPQYKYNEPADLIELIPIVRDLNRLIPKRFSIVNHQITLNSNEMVIKHHYLDVRAKRTRRNSIITVTYDDEGGLYNTYLEVPLLYSPLFGFSDWSMYPVGNYTMRITRGGLFSEEKFYIRALTRF